MGVLSYFFELVVIVCFSVLDGLVASQPVWPWTSGLPASTSQVEGTGMYCFICFQMTLGLEPGALCAELGLPL